jgi:hypothetical protein
VGASSSFVRFSQGKPLIQTWSVVNIENNPLVVSSVLPTVGDFLNGEEEIFSMKRKRFSQWRTRTL